MNDRTETCATHGEYASHQYSVNGRWTTCEECGLEASRQRREQEAREELRQRIAAKLTNSGIPSMYKVSQLGEAPEAWTDRVIARTSVGPLVMVGDVGTGKTYQACAALRRLIVRTQVGGYYVTAADYAALQRSTWNNRGGESEIDILNRYAKAPFLVLDDLGAGRDNDMQLVQGLIDARYRNGLMKNTVVVSNVSAANFDGAFGPRSADRIRENATLLPMIGESRRKPE